MRLHRPYIALLTSITTSVVVSLSTTNDASSSSSAAASALLINRRQAALLLSSSAAASAAAATVQPAAAVAAPTTISGVPPSSGVVTLPGDNIKFPLASFGLQIYSDEMAYKLTTIALQVGYRNFFSSCLTGNQRGFAKAIRDSGVPRNELFITGSVVSNRASGFDAAYKKTAVGCRQNMDNFAIGGIDYIDQIMLDYPGPDCESIRGQWKAFQEMHAQGLTRTLAVSNFSPTQLDCLIGDDGSSNNKSGAAVRIKPCVNQMPYSVAYHKPASLVDDNRKRGVLVQAWAPLGGSLGGRFDAKIKQACGTIGKRYNKSFAQVALRWIVQTGAAFTTQSTNRLHFVEDLNIFDFELTADEMTTLSNLAK